jgi:hypothetical protein
MALSSNGVSRGVAVLEGAHTKSDVIDTKPVRPKRWATTPFGVPGMEGVLGVLERNSLTDGALGDSGAEAPRGDGRGAA